MSLIFFLGKMVAASPSAQVTGQSVVQASLTRVGGSRSLVSTVAAVALVAATLSVGGSQVVHPVTALVGQSAVSATLSRSGGSRALLVSVAGVSRVYGLMTTQSGLFASVAGVSRVAGVLQKSGGSRALSGVWAGRSALSAVIASSGAYLPQPGFLSARQLASLQTTLLRSLPWRCEVLRRDTITSNGAGRVAATFAAIGSYSCDVEVATAMPEAVWAAEIKAGELYIITLPYNAVVTPQNRLVVNGVTYEIKDRAENWTDQACVPVFAVRVE